MKHRKLFYWGFVSLNGVMESPENWAFDPHYQSDEVNEFIKAQNLACEALLLGRITYEAFVTFWPFQTNNEFGFADNLNRIPKYVVSSTLEKAEWNNSILIKEHAIDEVAKLKQLPGGDIGITGSATLMQSLIKERLVDELNLLVYPILLEPGMHLFQDGLTANLKLISAKAFNSGVVLLSYKSS